MSFARIFVLSLSVALVGSECHCKTSCATFPDNPCHSVGGQDICQRGWFGPYCQRENVALDRPTNQSGTYSNSKGRYPSSFAVDGRTATTFYNYQRLPNNCTFTAVSTSNNWTVFLNKTASDRISHMRLYLRSEALIRYQGMVIRVEDVTCYDWLSSSGPDVSITNVTCRNPLIGNRVTISVPHILTLCEVQIFICSNGWFGNECDKLCNCHNETDVCDKISGQCGSGCAAGFNGGDCRTVCADGTFGINCSKICGKCLDNDVCDKTTGKCPRGCQPGWMIETCSHPCMDGYFGINCSSVCGRCFSGTVCNKTTGLCPGECEAGWRNQTCLDPCEDGRYGDRCNFTCGYCLKPSLCHKSTGHCLGGCQNNYAAPLCKVSDGPKDSGIPLVAVVAPCAIIIVILVVVVVILVRRKGISSKSTEQEPHYAEFEAKADDNYTSLTAHTYQNVQGSKEQRSETIELEDDHIYTNPVEDKCQ